MPEKKDIEYGFTHYHYCVGTTFRLYQWLS